MVLDPQKGKEAIAPDEPVRWCATDDFAYANCPEDEVDGQHESLDLALIAAKQRAAWGETVYVWPSNQAPSEASLITDSIQYADRLIAALEGASE